MFQDIHCASKSAKLASLSIHDKKAGDKLFLSSLKLIEQAAADERNFVKKALN